MTNDRGSRALRHVRTLYTLGAVGGLSDGQLLERFATRDGEAAELAFASLVERHGPMVLRVCRLVLRDEHDAQDAFQATFLVLARRFSSIHKQNSLASWLHGVAYRTASCVRSAEARRRRHERRAARAVSAQTPTQGDRDEVGVVLQEELIRLPDHYRTPIVVCDLEGQTHEQAARHLGWPVGTVKSRLARGRERLRGRLARRGLVVSASLAGALLPVEGASAAVSAALAEATIQAAMCYAVGRAAKVGMVSASVVASAEEVTRAILMSRLKLIAASLLVITATAAGSSAFLNASQGRDDGAAKEAASAPNRSENDLLQELRAAVGAVAANPSEDLVKGEFLGGIETLLVLAKAQASMRDRDAARETLRRAVQVADDAPEYVTRNRDRRPSLLAKVAWVQAKVGETQAARETLGKAMEATKLQRYKSNVLKTIVAVQTELRDFDAAKATLQSLRDATRNEDEPPGGRRAAWIDLITATAWTGDYEGASALTVDASRSLKDVGFREEGLLEIAFVACNRRDLEDSLRVATGLADLQTKQFLLRRIALFQAREGDVEGARVWINRLESSRLRASAMDGLAFGLAARVSGGWESQWALEP